LSSYNKKISFNIPNIPVYFCNLSKIYPNISIKYYNTAFFKIIYTNIEIYTVFFIMDVVYLSYKTFYHEKSVTYKLNIIIHVYLSVLGIRKRIFFIWE